MLPAMIAVLLLASASGDFGDAPAFRHLKGLPTAVRTHIERRLQCNHWGGESAYDADRERQIKAAVGRLRCATLEREERRLRRRYAGSPAILKALRDNRDVVD